MKLFLFNLILIFLNMILLKCLINLANSTNEHVGVRWF